MKHLKYPLRKLSGLFSAIIIAASLGGCDKGPEPVKGFVLPEGDVALGQKVFTEIGCRYCHTIADLALPPFEAEPVLEIMLGGKVLKVKSYGELLNSIVNPNHTVELSYKLKLDREDRKDAESPMPVFNDVLTVTELIDLAAFLHSRYVLLGPEYRGYMYVP
jgi:hypothetical protein